MKIALVSFLFEIESGGGAAAAVRMLAEGLLKQGYQVVVITTHAKRQLCVEQMGNLTIYRFCPQNLYWIGHKESQPVWKKALWQIADTWNPFVFQTVRSILLKEQPNLVHVHKLRGLSPAVWAAARSVGVGPIVQTCHDYELMSPEGTLSGQVGAWAREGNWLLRPYQQLRARLAHTLTTVTAPSQYVLDTFQQHGFFQSIKKDIVPNSHGFTTSQLEQQQARLTTIKANSNPQQLRLLYLGRLETTKGVDLLCEAFVRGATRFPHLHLDIAGWGSQTAALQKQYGQHPQLTFHGPVFNNVKSLLLEKSDILVLPSVWPEVFGIVVIEAYAYGLPVIATRTGGIPELVDHGKTGFLVSPGNLNTLTEAIFQIAENPKELRQMALACFLASKRFAIEVVQQQYLSIYETASRTKCEAI